MMLRCFNEQSVDLAKYQYKTFARKSAGFVPPRKTEIQWNLVYGIWSIYWKDESHDASNISNAPRLSVRRIVVVPWSNSNRFVALTGDNGQPIDRNSDYSLHDESSVDSTDERKGSNSVSHVTRKSGFPFPYRGRDTTDPTKELIARYSLFRARKNKRWEREEGKKGMCPIITCHLQNCRRNVYFRSRQLGTRRIVRSLTR